MNWWEYYYHQQYTKMLKTELQEICKEFYINPMQRKNLLIKQLVEKFTPIETPLTSQIDLESDEDVYFQSRTSQPLQFNNEITIGNRVIRLSETLRQHEIFLRSKLYEMEELIDHREIKLQINSILDIIKKPNCTPIEQSENIIPLLFDHQKQNISWMNQLESNVDRNDTISMKNYPPYLIPVHDQLVYSCYSRRFNFHHPKKIEMTYQGGILADSVGIGKTLTCIGLMMEKTREPINYFSKANLVLCPSHLAQQWFDEITNNTIGLSVVMIRTKKDWELLTYQDVMTCDVVIVTHQFLLNPYYNYRSLSWTSYHQIRPNLEMINWYRIFVDEGHELVYNIKLWKMILNLQSKYKWYVSGTPFIDGDALEYPDYCIYHIARFLGINIRIEELVAPNDIKSIKPNLEFMQEFMKLMIRNTKESTNLKLPEIVVEDKLIEFHKTEKGRYEMTKNRARTSRKWLLQLCCSMNLADQDIKEFGAERTLEQIHEIMIKNQEEKLGQKKNTLENSKPKREETVITPERKEIIDRLTYEINAIEKSLNYLKIVLNQITDEQSCPVCLEVIEDLAITDCGQIFCSQCIEQCLATNGKCPNCRNKTNYMIVSTVNNDQINKYGTKITNLIEYLKQINEKVIIFSQWDRLLHKVGDILKQEEFPNVFCQGSIFQRNKCLQEFRKKDIQILMMSLHYAVSGTNLTEANHVIILDIFDGTSDDIKKKESQAIGRVHRLGQKREITVVRFIMQDTLEEELYKKLINQDDNVIADIHEDEVIIL